LFLHLKKMGVGDAYRRAAILISHRGFSRSLTCDPYSGAVDVEGAILLSCGASEKRLHEGRAHAHDCGAPEASVIKILMACDYFEAMTDEDIAEWSRNHSQSETITILNKLADRIDITVVSPLDDNQ